MRTAVDGGGALACGGAPGTWGAGAYRCGWRYPGVCWSTRTWGAADIDSWLRCDTSNVSFIIKRDDASVVWRPLCMEYRSQIIHSGWANWDRDKIDRDR